MSDLIDRQQAIDALDKHIDTFDAIDTNYLCGLRTAMSFLKEMPPAQPDLDEWCPDCKEYDPKRHCCPRFNKVIRGAYKDLQEQRKSAYLIDPNPYGECSNCGQLIDIRDGYIYCPNCGYYLRGESDETIFD